MAFSLIRFFGEVPPGQNLEAAVGAAAFGSVIAAPGVLALLALRASPALLLPGALVLIPLSFISFALVTLPLLIPAFLMFRTYARAAPKGSGGRAAVTSAAVLALFVSAFIVLFAGHDAREFVTDTSAYSTSDVVTYAEAAQSLALTMTGIVFGWWAHRTPSREVLAGRPR
ncbi:MAG: hypothetical protein ACRDWD_06430 [Acidimicrobiia bacterium]